MPQQHFARQYPMNTIDKTPPHLTILRLKQLLERTGLSKSTVYDKLNPRSPRYDGSFPRQIHVSAGIVGWLQSEVDAWLQSKVEASRV
jgi:prophage regulatory protein